MIIEKKISGWGEQMGWGKLFIYLFFLVHMAGFGASGFALSYFSEDLFFVYLHSGIAITVYIIFYLVIFGLDKVFWMFVGGVLGYLQVFGIIDLILGRFGKTSEMYSFQHHLIPMIYVIMYTFLMRHIFIDLTKLFLTDSQERIGNIVFVVVQIGIFILINKNILPGI